MTVATANDAPTIQIGLEKQTEQRSRGLAILFAESIDSNTPGDNLDTENVARGTISQHNELIAEIVRKHQGQIIKMMGASVAAEFADLPAAAHAAVAMQRLSLELTDASSKSIRPGLRIGIDGLIGHSQSMDFFGASLQAAAIITKHALPGQILVSQKVCGALGNETDLHLQWFRTVGINPQGESEDIFEVHWMPAVANIPSRYEALFQVGAGGMGIVYKARDRETGEIVALKILRSEIASDATMQENLRREVRLARKVTHKNVCRIHEFNRSNGMACISMEFVEGASLQSTLQRSGAIPWNQALKIALQLCAGLGEAHAQGIVHRDLKPANIMMDRSGVAKIMDFGIARSFQGTNQMTGTLVGTPAYMAPEQVELKNVDARTDVYALGLLLYEIVTGLQAFEGNTPIAVAVKQLREFPKRPREIAPTLPADAEAVILRCLEKDPAKRFQAMEELSAALNSNAQIRYASSLWGTFLKDLRSYRHNLRANLQPQMQALGQFWRKQDWRSLIQINRRTQKVLAVGLGGACLLGISTLTIKSSRRSHKIAAAAMGNSPAAVSQSSQVFATKMIAAGDADKPTTPDLGSPSAESSFNSAATATWSHEVDLSSSSGRESRTQSLPNLQPPVQVPSKAKAAKIGQKKLAPAVKTATPSSGIAKATTAQDAAQSKMPLLASASSSVLSASSAGSGEGSIEDTPSEPAASRSVIAPPATSATTAMEENPSNNGAAQANHYLDVGSFKESTWADQAVEKLTQLGFHATSVRKNLLWVQSYQVRVGPYTDTKDLENAKQSLISQGFKPHIVK